MCFSFATPSPSPTHVSPCHQLLSFHLIYSVSNHWTKSSAFEKSWSSPRHSSAPGFLFLASSHLILKDSAFKSPLRGIISCNLESLFMPVSEKKYPLPFRVNDWDINNEIQWYFKDSFGPWRLCRAAWGPNEAQLTQQVASFGLWKIAAASLREENTPGFS